MSKFYVVKPIGGIMFGTRWAYADQIDPVYHGDAQYCPECGGRVSGSEWDPPHRVKLSIAKPDKWGDFVWGAGFYLLVSDRFKQIYEREGLTGIHKFFPPVEIVRVGTRKSGDLPAGLPSYHSIQILWGGASQDDDKSGLSREHPELVKCQFCRKGALTYKKQNKIVIDEQSWDGSDLFWPRGAPVQLMVSERFREVSEKYALKNIWLIPAENYAYDENRGKEVSQPPWYIRED